MLSGVATFVDAEQSWRVEYAIDIDDAWCTTRCTVRGSSGDRHVATALARDAEGRWTVDGRRSATLDQCEDVDLGFTPATNLLPVRRLQLAIGETAHVRAAWVQFPPLRVEVLEQDYTRLDANTYLYESAGGTFRRELIVNEHGLVVDYPGLWIADQEA